LTNGAQPTTLSWSHPIKWVRGKSMYDFGQKRSSVGIQAYGDSLSNIAGYDFLDQIGAQLRRKTSYASMKALAADFLPGFEIQNHTSCGAMIIAPFPFMLQQRDRANRTTVELIAAPLADPGDIQIRAFFKPEGGDAELTATALTKKENHGSVRRNIKMKWPRSAWHADCSVFYKEHEVDQLEIGRWPGLMHLRVAVNSYFDPQNLLADLLKGKGKGKEQDNFELGVIRLLNLLGIPAAWYGQGALERRSDAAAYVKLNRRRFVFLCECTVESPDRKFSPLKERAEQLDKHLKGEAEVRPLLFCPTEPVDSQYRDANEHGITLIGKKQLSELTKLLETGLDSDATVRTLEKFKSSQP